MTTSGNYPPGVNSQTPGAPWNFPDIPSRQFHISCSQSLSKTVTVRTADYALEKDDTAQEVYADTSDTNWGKAYIEEHYTPIQLISHLKEFLLTNLKQGLVFKSPAYTKHLIEECSGWCADETEYIE